VRLPLFDAALWVAGPLVNAVLLIVLFIRRRLLQFSTLAVWSAFSILSSGTLFWVSRLDSRTYARTYWAAEAIDALLQLSVVVQVAEIVFRPLRQVIRTKRLVLIVVATTIALIAFLLTLSVHPPAHTFAGIFEIRGQLFTSILICSMFTTVLFFSQKLGLYWRSHVMSVGYGLTAWAVACVVLDLLHGYLGRGGHFLAVEHVRMFIYLCILCYWIFALWRDEPEKEQPSGEMRDAILHLTDKVSYDLAKVLGTRGKEFH
jgi:hypothetical protein